MQQIISNLADDIMTPCELTGVQVKDFVMRALIAPSGKGKKPLFTVETLAERLIYIQPTEADMANIPTNSVIVVADYPFGRHKCVRIEFMEWRNKYGYRHVTATSDQHLTKFNAPNLGMYNMGVISLGWGETNGKEHAVFNMHTLSVYGVVYATTATKVGECIEKASQLLNLNLTEFDKGFVESYLKICNKKLDKLAQQM